MRTLILTTTLLATLALATMATMADVSATASPTHTPVPTQTPYPTYTERPTYTSVPTASPTPSPSPSPTPHPQGQQSDGSYCLGLPFTNWCPDLGGLVSGVAGAAWNALTVGLSGTLHSMSSSLLHPLTSTPDLRGNQELTRVQGVLSQDATEAIAVLFGIAALWCVQPRFFGSVEQGVALLWRSALVIATLRTLNPLMTLWTDVVNALAAGVGGANLVDTGHSGMTLVVAPVLLLFAGLERAASLYTLGLCYMVAPIFIVLAIYPPAARLCRAWLFLFVSTSTMGVAYALAINAIVAMGIQEPGLWGEVMTLAGFFFLTLVPAIWGGLTLAAGQGTGGALGKAAGVAEMALAL